MEISLRSQLAAGVAVAGAAAIAVTPIVQPEALPSLSRISSAVELSAFVNPIDTLLSTVGLAGQYLLDSGYGTGTQWAGAGISNTLNGLLQLPKTPGPDSIPLPGYVNRGLIPQILSDSLPIVTQLANNALDYAYNTAAGLLAAAGDLSNVVWAVPATVAAVVTDLLTLNVAQIIPDIIDGFDTAINGVIDAAGTLVDTATYLVRGVITRAVAVVETVGTLLPGILNGTVNQVTAVVNAVVNNAQAIIGSVLTLNPQNIWNTTVGALLGPAGLPGTVLNLTIGAGIQNPPVDSTVPEQLKAFAPSIRTEVQTANKAIQRALATPVPSAAAVSPAAAAEVSASAVKADVAEAPAAEVSAPQAAASDDAPQASAGSDDNAPKKAAAKQRVSRKAS